MRTIEDVRLKLIADLDRFNEPSDFQKDSLKNSAKAEYIGALLDFMEGK